jgi:hypothetical protein
MRQLLRWKIPLYVLLAGGTLLARPAAASAAGCWQYFCFNCTCSLRSSECTCSVCFPYCIAF